MLKRSLNATALVGATTFTVVLVTGTPTPTVPEQTAFLLDAGYTGATHVATCPVRFDPSCVAVANDAGIPVHAYERLRFPVAIINLADGGRDVQLPPMNLGIVQECFRVVDWSDCALATAASAPAIAGLIGQQLPFSLAGAVRKCVRPKFDAGLTCLHLDGGSTGDRNVFARTDATDPNNCESVECAVYLGSDPETEL